MGPRADQGRTGRWDLCSYAQRPNMLERADGGMEESVRKEVGSPRMPQSCDLVLQLQRSL